MNFVALRGAMRAAVLTLLSSHTEHTIHQICKEPVLVSLHTSNDQQGNEVHHVGGAVRKLEVR